MCVCIHIYIYMYTRETGTSVLDRYIIIISDDKCIINNARNEKKKGENFA